MAKRASKKAPTKRPATARAGPGYETTEDAIDELAHQPLENGQRRSYAGETRAVRAYLNAIGVTRKRGRKVTRESLQQQMQRNAELLADETEPVERLALLQKGLDLAQRLENLEAEDSIHELEQQFVQCAQSYSRRKGISYAAWREVGVSPEVLRKAGIPR